MYGTGINPFFMGSFYNSTELTKVRIACRYTLMLFGIYAGKSNVVMETDVRAWRDIEITLSSTSSLVNKSVVNGILMPLEYAKFPLSSYWHILTTFNLLYFMPHLFNVKLHICYYFLPFSNLVSDAYKYHC